MIRLQYSGKYVSYHIYSEIIGVVSISLIHKLFIDVQFKPSNVIMKRRQVLQSMAGAAGIGLATAPSQGQIDGQVKETQFNPSSTESFKKFEDVFGSLAVETLDHTEEKKETGVRTLSQIKTDIGTGRVVSIHTEENSKNITALDIERSNLVNLRKEMITVETGASLRI